MKLRRLASALLIVALAAQATGCAGAKTFMHAEGVAASGIRVSPSEVYSNKSMLIVKFKVFNDARSPVVLDPSAACLTLPDGHVLSAKGSGQTTTIDPGGSTNARVDFKSDGFEWKSVRLAQLNLANALLISGSPSHVPPIEVLLEARDAPLAQIERNQIVINDQIQFRVGSADILGDSDPIVDAVAEILAAHPNITKLHVEGHTDNTGGSAANLELSKRRAASVLAALVSRGVARSRLTSAGFGDSKPLDTNDNDDGRQRNRRVEFHMDGQ